MSCEHSSLIFLRKLSIILNQLLHRFQPLHLQSDKEIFKCPEFKITDRGGFRQISSKSTATLWAIYGQIYYLLSNLLSLILSIYRKPAGNLFGRFPEVSGQSVIDGPHGMCKLKWRFSSFLHSFLTLSNLDLLLYQKCAFYSYSIFDCSHSLAQYALYEN